MIAATRQQAAAIAGELGVRVHDTVPEQIQPPCVVVQPADPFVTDSDPDATFGEPFAISWELLLLVPLDDEHDNAQAAGQLDTMLDDLIDALDATPWTLSRMDKPGGLATLDWIAHGQRVTIRRMAAL